MAKSLLPIITCLIAAFIAGYALLHPGLPPTHDGEYHVIRFYQFDKVLRSGAIYPRWAPDLNFGYGVPLFNYVYPLPNYVASFLTFFGVSYIDAFKLNLFFATLVGALFFYLWAKEHWGTTGGVVSSVFYSFTPYRFVDIYVRGSVGEVWALAFFPGFLWAVKKYSGEGKYTYLVLSSLFLAATIFSHNILAVMFFLYSLTYMGLLIVFSKRKKHLLLSFLFSAILGLGLSAVFWLPALLEKQFVTGLQIYNVKDNFPELFQLLIPSWGTGFSGGTLEGQMSFQIGVANLLALFVAFVYLAIFLKQKNKLSIIVGFQLVWFFIIFFLMLRISYSLWKTIPVIDYFQFPWRFLSLAMLITSFLAGSISVLTKKKIISIIFAILAIIFSFGYARPDHYLMRTDAYYLTRSNFIDGTNSPGNYFNTIWKPYVNKRARSKIDTAQNQVHIISSSVLPANYAFKLKAGRETGATVNTTYFPGWSIFVDRNPIEVKNKNGLLSFKLPKGEHLVEVAFLDTMIRQASEILFLLSAVAMFALPKIKRFHRMYENSN